LAVLIEPSPSSLIGWTPDKFSGYIAVQDKTVWIKVIQSKKRRMGYLRNFFLHLLYKGYIIKVVDPKYSMEKICIHYHMKPVVEEFDGKECIVWTLTTLV
jgi:hypothetical protein